MKFGPNSTRTYQAEPVREPQHVFMAPSRRHATRSMQKATKYPFAHYLPTYPVHGWKVVKGKVGFFTKWVERSQPTTSHLQYHATKGFRRVSPMRL